MRSTGLVLVAGGISLANEVVFAPAASGSTKSIADTFNWRLIPATLILATVLGGLEELSPGFAVGLAGLVVGSVLIIPMGKAPSPIDNITKTLGY